MPALYSVAANLPHNCRKLLAIEALAGNDPISRIAVREDVSRKFLYQQKQKAEAALDQAFSPDNKPSDVLFYLPRNEGVAHSIGDQLGPDLPQFIPRHHPIIGGFVRHSDQLGHSP